MLMLEVDNPIIQRKFTGGRVDKTGFSDYYRVQFVCTEGGGTMTAPGISTESIPPIFAAGSCYPVDQLGLVGPWDKTEQSVLPGSDKKNDETDPSGPVGTDASFKQIQPVAEGPVGQYITHSPVGPDGMLSTCDSDQPMDEGPVCHTKPGGFRRNAFHV